MSKIYSAHVRSNMFAVISANSKEEALDVFMNNQINNDIIRKHISEFIVGDSFFNRFYQDEIGPFYNGLTEDFPARIQEMSSTERSYYILSSIENNVKEYWKNSPQFSAEYIEQLNENNRSTEFYIGKFSNDFWFDTVKRVIKEDKWYGEIEINEIELEHNNYQLIYEE